MLALPSRTRTGRPRILAQLPAGQVSSTGLETDFVVTEYGIAQLRGATATQRGARLIAVAHPADREWLRTEWKRAPEPAAELV